MSLNATLQHSRCIAIRSENLMRRPTGFNENVVLTSTRTAACAASSSYPLASVSLRFQLLSPLCMLPILLSLMHVHNALQRMRRDHIDAGRVVFSGSQRLRPVCMSCCCDDACARM